MAELGNSGFSQFDRLVAVVRRTRELLDAVAADGALPSGGADFLAAAALPHLEGIQDGFRGWLRADAAGRAEMRYLVSQHGSIRAAGSEATWPGVLGHPDGDRTGGPDPAHGDRPAEPRHEGDVAQTDAAVEARMRARTTNLRRPEAWHLAALGHARLVLAFLPRLPDDAVRFPAGRRTYADIPVPRGPAELSERIDELERELWLTAVGHPAPRTDPAFRRTYGFFDAAERFGATGRLAG
jgi:hypothetical protein